MYTVRVFGWQTCAPCASHMYRTAVTTFNMRVSATCNDNTHPRSGRALRVLHEPASLWPRENAFLWLALKGGFPGARKQTRVNTRGEKSNQRMLVLDKK
jgi:hypothetical protein